MKLQKVEDLRNLRRADITDYILRRSGESKWSARTIRNHIQSLFNFFNYCQENFIIEKNPAEGIKKPKPPKDLPRLISKDEALSILEWLYFAEFRFNGERERAKAIVGMLIFTGIRRSELIGIKNSDIDFKRKIVRVNSGKGNKDRVIPMNDKLIEILKEYLKCSIKFNSPCMYFFVKLDGKNRMGVNSIRGLFDKIKKTLKIDVTPHKLRHTFATLMANSGCTLTALSRMMGHSSIKTTQVYLWLDASNMRHEIQKHPLGYMDDLPHRLFNS